MRKSEFGMRNGEFGLRPIGAYAYAPAGRRNLECGMRNGEVGMRTRRRPMGRDYAAAKDAEFE